MTLDATWVWAAKGTGATIGSAISLAYLLPRGRREAAIRFMVGLTTGLVFGSPAGLWIAARLDLTGQLPETELALVGSAAASLGAWWALGALQRFMERSERDAGENLRAAARRWPAERSSRNPSDHEERP